MYIYDLYITTLVLSTLRKYIYTYNATVYLQYPHLVDKYLRIDSYARNVKTKNKKAHDWVCFCVCVLSSSLIFCFFAECSCIARGTLFIFDVLAYLYRLKWRDQSRARGDILYFVCCNFIFDFVQFIHHIFVSGVV